ncbi:MAG: universal stress protein [Thermoleophilia bacterium]|nr:universal stress protein [Thermoleophilia bacterium]
MGNYSKILVAFDGSQSSRNALAQTLAGFEHGWIKVVVVVPSYDGDLELIGVSDLEALLRGPADELADAAREITLADAGRVNIEVVKGEAYEKIVDLAVRENCTLTVMGRRGLHRVERMLMGSVTEKVIVHSPTDVLVIPRNASVSWDNILVATDGSEYSRAALDKALLFARETGGRLQAVSVVDIYPETYADAPEVVAKMEEKALTALEDTRRKAGAEGIVISTQLLHGDPGEEISKMAAGGRAGILFVGNRGRTGLKKIFLGSVAQKVIGLSACPVFVSQTAS